MRQHITRTILLCGVTLLMGGVVQGIGHAADTGRVIKVTAKKFEYTPKHIVIKKGEHVVLEMTAVDRLHGFAIPQLGLRGDIEPGKVLRITVPTQIPGRYEFICDIFCGERHEEMAGTLLIEE